MLASLAVLVVLQQTPAPLVPTPLDLPDRALMAEPPPPPHELDREGGLSSTRVLASIGSGVLVAGVVSGATLYLDSIPTCAAGTGGSSCQFAHYAVLGAAAVAGTALVTLGTWVVHRALGGRGGIGWTAVGTFTAALVGALVGGVIGLPVTGRLSSVPIILGANVLSAIAGGLMSEVGHLRALDN